MRKILAVLLVAALCLSFTGCALVAKTGDAINENVAESNKYEKYDALIEAIEANDFEKAYAELVRFANEAEGVSQPTEEEEFAELAKNAVGEWITFHEDVTDAKTLILNEDGTGFYDTENFTWAVDYGDEDYFTVKCMVNGVEFKYYINFNRYDGESVYRCSVNIVEVQDEYSWTSTHEDESTYFDRYNKDVLEIVDITAENFNDYFEVRPEPYWNLNEFGEPESWGRGHYVFLRPEYAERLAIDDSEIKVQYTGKEVYYYCDVDLENMKLEMGEAIPNREKEDIDETTSFRLYNSYDNRFPEEYAVTYFSSYSGNGYFNGEECTFATNIEDLNIERAAGLLVLTK